MSTVQSVLQHLDNLEAAHQSRILKSAIGNLASHAEMYGSVTEQDIAEFVNAAADGRLVRKSNERTN